MFCTMFYVVLLCAEFATAMDANVAKPAKRQWWRSRPKTRRQSGTYDPGGVGWLEKFRKARSRLYRSQILQVNTRWKALGEIYKIHMLLHRSELNISAKNRRQNC